MAQIVDVLVLSRDAGPLRRQVMAGLESQRNVRCRVYRVIGSPRNSDQNRYETIARARNRAKPLGTAPWAMFLDDDVVLSPNCIDRLVTALDDRPSWGALAADYLGQSEGKSHVNHVGMGATLFRRDVLRTIPFRWQPGRCECRCCCDDLERRGIGVGYLPSARARHLPRQADNMQTRLGDSPHQEVAAETPQVLAALDAHHLDRFYRIFLRTFAATQHRVPIIVVAYGLSRSEQASLTEHPNVADVVMVRGNGCSPGVRRVHDFQQALERLQPDRAVAYWDAGDVMFQASLDGLWETVRQNPGKLLVVREPASHPENRAIATWTSRIPDLNVRRYLFTVLSRRPFFNSGFLAGTVGTVTDYLRFADRFLRSTNLLREPPADQLALNYYCQSNESSWAEIDEGWNYCLAYRKRRILQPRRPDESDWDRHLAALPRVVTPEGRTVPVVHGNGHTLEAALTEWWARCPRTS